MSENLHTALFDHHVRRDARMVPFAGYSMPVQYKDGIIAEHNWTRENAGLFDVSHMGQCYIKSDSFETSARALERLVPADILGLQPGQQRYSQLLNEQGGILDDVMITRSASSDFDGWIYVVVNAGRKLEDYVHFKMHLPNGVELQVLDDVSLIALQGPRAEEVLQSLKSHVDEIPFMSYATLKILGVTAHVSRSGYSGEDGFEISVKNADAPKMWDGLLEHPLVKPVGLGARDSLRLEAGLCLYGHDIDETTSPIEAGLAWSIAKRRREEGGFIGAERVQRELREGVSRKRIGIKPTSRAPAREGTIIQNLAGGDIGRITSGGFGPTVQAPISMGYVDTKNAVVGTPVNLMVRGNAVPAIITKLPFIPNRFKRGTPA